MTLIITAVTKRQIVMVSDRRLTNIGRDGSLTLNTDSEGKHLYIRCFDAHFSVAYTGVAQVVDGRNGKLCSTIKWVADILADFGAAYRPCSQIVEYFEDTIAVQYRKFGPRHPTCFVLPGYKYHKFNDRQFKCEHFVTSISSVDRQPLKRIERGGGALWIHGAVDAISNQVSTRLTFLMKPRVFENLDGQEVATKLVAVIREASESENDGDAIGHNCMSGILKPDDRSVLFTHHSMDREVIVSPIFIIPDFAYGSGVRFTLHGTDATMLTEGFDRPFSISLTRNGKMGPTEFKAPILTTIHGVVTAPPLPPWLVAPQKREPDSKKKE